MLFLARLAAVFTLMLATFATASADPKPFLHQGVAADAKRYEAYLKANWKPDGKSPAALKAQAGHRDGGGIKDGGTHGHRLSRSSGTGPRLRCRSLGSGLAWGHSSKIPDQKRCECVAINVFEALTAFGCIAVQRRQY